MRIQTTNRTYHVDASDLMDAWRKGNDNGEGYAVGDEDVLLLAEISLLEVSLFTGGLRWGHVVATSNDRVIVICDANGPWAVDVTDALDKMKGCLLWLRQLSTLPTPTSTSVTVEQNELRPPLRPPR